MFECPYCEVQINFTNFMTHINNCHRHQKSEESKCKICSRSFSKFQTLRNHIIKEHTNNTEKKNSTDKGQNKEEYCIDLSTDRKNEGKQLCNQPSHGGEKEKQSPDLLTINNKATEEQVKSDVGIEAVRASKNNYIQNSAIKSCSSPSQSLPQIIDLQKLVLGQEGCCQKNTLFDAQDNILQQNHSPQVVEFDAIKISAIESLAKNFSAAVNTTKDLDYKNYSKMIDEEVDKIVSYLFAKPTFCREDVKDVIDLFKSFYNVKIIEFLRSRNKDDQLDIFLQITSNAFNKFSSEHLTLEYFFKKGFYIKPITFKICSYHNPAPRRVLGRRKIPISHHTVEVVPLDLVLKKFLEMPEVYQTILTYIDECKKSTRKDNLFKSSLYTSLESTFGGKTMLPCILFSDEFQVNNTLGSHKSTNKVNGLYVSLACLPDEFRSRLENIFLLQLHKIVKDKMVTNKKLFGHAIRLLKKLETDGIEIKVNGELKRVYFFVFTITGDNLGMNDILGFQKGFKGKYPCRICKVTDGQLKIMHTLDKSLMRTLTEYNEHAKDMMFGIRESCAFNDLQSYHVISNACVDLMHDLKEGICRYVLIRILRCFIKIEKYFTLRKFNQRLAAFPNVFPECNKIPQFTELIFKKKQLIIYSSEMIFLMQNLGLIIGDLVPVKDRHWKLYLSLRNIETIIMSHDVTADKIKRLDKLITMHLKDYQDMFPDDTLKFKFHMLLHYTDLMIQLGPLKNFWCMRFEARHRVFIRKARATTSRLNICHTLAIGNQLQLCHTLVCNEGFKQRILTSLKKPFKFEQKYENIQNLFNPNNKLLTVSWIRKNGTYYSSEASNMALSIGQELEAVSFGKIEAILLENDEAYFIYEKLSKIKYVTHICAFVVQCSGTFDIIKQCDLKFYWPNYFCKINGKFYVSERIFHSSKF